MATGAFKDIAAALVTSSYKWLTSTLLTAQQQFAVRPYFTAKVVDDTIQPRNQWFSGAGLPLGKGSTVVAPDGTAFAFGLDASNNLCVFNAPDLNAVSGVWPNKVILSTGGDNFLDPLNVYSIQCSAPYNGKYRLTAWYFGNFLNDGTNLTIKMQYSDDGGVTWTKLGFTPNSLPNDTLGNVSLASFTPVFNGTVMKMGCFYIKPNTATFASGFVGYDIYYIYGDTSSGLLADVKWFQNANSYDWTIHSLGAYYLNGLQYCAFSGFRNVLDSVGVNANYSVWVTATLNIARVSAKDLWMAPVPVLPVGSASSVNQNSFTFPSGTVSNGMVYLTALATLVDSVSQTSQGQTAQVVTTHVSTVMVQSDDGTGFSYPSVFVGTDGVEFNSGTYSSFVLQTPYWYLGGGLGYLWQLTQNNIVADITADVIGYSISEQAGQPSTVSLKLANANNKWVGASPTGPGATAVARNRKIAIWQGYYNANGIPEAVPRNVYFIDDIQQQISGTQNDVLLVGRDLYKALKTTVTKFSYQMVGPLFFSDIFDGTFMSSWNQVAGVWQFLATLSPPVLFTAASASTPEQRIMLVGTNGNSYGAFMRVFFQNHVSGGVPHSHVYFYAVYIDDDNWLRLDLDTEDGSAWKVTSRVNGSSTDLDSGNLPSPLDSSGSHFYGVYVRRYDYYRFNFMIDLYGGATGNEIQNYDPSQTSYVFKNSGTGDYDLSGVFNQDSTWQTGFTVGLGVVEQGPQEFRFFTYTQFNNPTSLRAVFRRIARLAGIFSFKLVYAWRELLFQNNFSGGTITNRILSVTAGNQAISQVNQMSNGEVSFRAKIAVANGSNPAGFSFIFRKANDSSGQDDYYKLHFIQASTGFANPPVFSRFERYIQNAGKTYYFYNTPYDVSNNQSTLGSLNIDLTQWHTYRVVMIDGWFWAFVDDVMVAAWNDNNTTWDYQMTGKWGFEADTNTALQAEQITAPDFWKPVRAFSYNPGDDAESAMESLIASLRGWMFSDLLGRLKVILLGATDPSTYTYDSQLFQQKVDESDKEYASQVTVYGNGVVATARNTTLMPGVRTRDIVILDYTITTQTDAQTRANNVLINSNQYLNQNASKQVINVGAELFDVVTVTNTGNNTSGVNGPTRVYDQTIDQGGGNNNSEYFLEIDTGNLE